MLARYLSPLFTQRADGLSIPSALGTGYGILNVLVRRIFGSSLPSVVFGKQDCFDKLVQFVQVDIAEYWTAHASYNVAKKVLAFVYQVAIPRSHLRATYGGGFQGAPLRCTKRQEEGSFPRGLGVCDEQAFSQEKQGSEGADHV